MVTNVLQDGGTRLVRVMGNAPIGEGWREMVRAGAEAEVRRWQDPGGAHVLEATWPVQEVVDVYFEGLPRGFRRFVAWKIHGRISEAIKLAAQHFGRCFGRAPMFAFVRSLPAGVESGYPLTCELLGVEFEVQVHVAEWAMEGVVFIGAAQERLTAGG